MLSRIELKGLRFFAYHGLYEDEKKNGAWFIVDVSFNCDAAIAIESDSIDGTVNYEDIYKIVMEEMKITSNLIEHVAGRIYFRINKEVKDISELKITLYKPEAPLGGPLDYVSITLQ